MLPLSDESLKKTLRSEEIWKFYKNLCFNCKHGLAPIPPPPPRNENPTMALENPNKPPTEL